MFKLEFLTLVHSNPILSNINSVMLNDEKNYGGPVVVGGDNMPPLAPSGSDITVIMRFSKVFGSIVINLGMNADENSEKNCIGM